MTGSFLLELHQLLTFKISILLYSITHKPTPTFSVGWCILPIIGRTFEICRAIHVTKNTPVPKLE